MTQHPDNLAFTNIWTFVGDTDVDGISIGPSDPDHQEFTIHARTEKKASCRAFMPFQLACVVAEVNPPGCAYLALQDVPAVAITILHFAVTPPRSAGQV